MCAEHEQRIAELEHDNAGLRGERAELVTAIAVAHSALGSVVERPRTEDVAPDVSRR